MYWDHVNIVSFSCDDPDCGSTFPTRAELAHHYQVVHKVILPLKFHCPGCYHAADKMSFKQNKQKNHAKKGQYLDFDLAITLTFNI